MKPLHITCERDEVKTLHNCTLEKDADGNTWVIAKCGQCGFATVMTRTDYLQISSDPFGR